MIDLQRGVLEEFAERARPPQESTWVNLAAAPPLVQHLLDLGGFSFPFLGARHQARWRERHPEKLAAQNKRYHAKHRAELLAYKKAWRQKRKLNPGRKS